MLAHKIVLVLFGHPKLTYHKHKDPELRPVTLWLHLLSKTVLAIVSLSHDPLDKPSVHTAACTAWALPSNTRQLPFDTKHLGKSVNCRTGRGKIVKHGDNIHNFCSCMFTFNNILVLSTLFTSSYYLIRHLPRQANPAAEEASPAAVGKLFTEQMWTLWDKPMESNSVSPSLRLFLASRRTMQKHTHAQKDNGVYSTF